MTNFVRILIVASPSRRMTMINKPQVVGVTWPF